VVKNVSEESAASVFRVYKTGVGQSVYWPGQRLQGRRLGVRFAEEAKNDVAHQSVRSGSGANLLFCSIGTGR